VIGHAEPLRERLVVGVIARDRYDVDCQFAGTPSGEDILETVGFRGRQDR
jgi:hypothetical protein